MILMLSIVAVLGFALIHLLTQSDMSLATKYSVHWEFKSDRDLEFEDVLEFVRIQYEDVHFMDVEAKASGIEMVNPGEGSLQVNTLLVRGLKQRTVIVDSKSKQFPKGNLMLYQLIGTLVLESQ